MATDLVRDPNELTDEELMRRQAAAELADRAARGLVPITPPNDVTAARAADSRPSYAEGSKEEAESAPDVGLKPIAAAGGTPGIVPSPEGRPLRPVAEPGSIEDTKDRLATIQWEKAHPWGTPGSTHPGTFGKIGHVLGKIGNIAGEFVAPNIMASTPGTELHRQLTEANLSRRLGEQEKEQSEEGFRKAQEENLRSEVAARQGPKLLTGENDTAVVDGTRYNAWQVGQGGPRIWAPEGERPTLGAPAGTGLPQVGAPTEPAKPGALPSIAPAPAQAGLPAGAVVGKPKAADDKEKFVLDYLKDNKLADTAVNRKAALDAYGGTGPIGKERADQYTSQIANVLKGLDIDAGGYTVTKDSTKAEAAEALKAAQQEASAERARKNAERVAGAPEAAQERKDKRTMGYAADANGKLMYVSRYDAEKAGSTFEEMKPGDVKADRQAIRMLNEVQSNVSAYTKAARDYQAAQQSGEINTRTALDDQAKLHNILNKAGIFDLKLGGKAFEVKLPLIDAAVEALNRESKSSAYNELSPQGKALFDGYLRTMSAVPAYQKALTNIGRTNKEMLDLELHNIGDPSMRAEDIIRKQGAFQINIDRAAEGFPQNLPGLKLPGHYREEVEGAAGKTLTYDQATGTVK